MSVKIQNKRTAEKGSALVYILIAIALLAALTVSFMQPASQQTSSQNTFKTVTSVQAQADLIRSAIQECVLSYPKGDRCINDDPSLAHCTTTTTSDPGARENYPINPDSTHYTSATPSRAGNRFVRNMRCPGNNPGDTADHVDHEPIFSGASGKFLPPASDLFGDWQLYNGTDGVFFWTATNKTDAFLLSALEKSDERYAECEADVIDTLFAPAGAKNLDSGGTVNCPANNVCFRVWMLANTATNIYPGDRDSDEAACP